MACIKYECEHCHQMVDRVCLTNHFCIQCHSLCEEDDFPNEEEWMEIERLNE